MTPPSPDQHPCRGCFLEQQRGGRVCPAAREVHGLPDVATERHAEALHAAILADARSVVPTFAELVRLDAASRTGALPASIRLGLAAALSSDSVPTDSRKEIVRVTLASRTQR
jgi:hypothetical protein